MTTRRAILLGTAVGIGMRILRIQPPQAWMQWKHRPTLKIAHLGPWFDVLLIAAFVLALFFARW